MKESDEDGWKLCQITTLYVFEIPFFHSRFYVKDLLSKYKTFAKETFNPLSADPTK